MAKKIKFFEVKEKGKNDILPRQFIAYQPEEDGPVHEERYWFELRRIKDKDTRIERLVIDCYVDNSGKWTNGITDDKFNGTITTNLDSLDNDIRKFTRYGVAFNRNAYAKLARAIWDNYRDLVEHVAEKPKQKKDTDAFNGVTDKIKEFVQDVLAEYNTFEYRRGEYLALPVSAFNQIFEGLDNISEILNQAAIEKQPDLKTMSYYDTNSIRQHLIDAKQIHDNNGQITPLKRIKDKPMRVLLFPYSEWDNITAPEPPQKAAASEKAVPEDKSKQLPGSTSKVEPQKPTQSKGEDKAEDKE